MAARDRIGERLSLLSNGAEPLVPLRHARAGRIGEAGQMPSGWRSEHLDDIEIHDLGSRGLPWITFHIGFGADIPGEYAGLGMAAYLPAPKTATIVLAAQVTLGEWRNLDDVLLIVRESKSGGGLVGQATRSLERVEDPQSVVLSHSMIADGGVVEPILMMKRATPGSGGLTVTLRGLAFGNFADYPLWRFSPREIE
jgi:hypothetical protein